MALCFTLHGTNLTGSWETGELLSSTATPATHLMGWVEDMDGRHATVRNSTSGSGIVMSSTRQGIYLPFIKCRPRPSVDSAPHTLPDAQTRGGRRWNWGEDARVIIQKFTRLSYKHPGLAAIPRVDSFMWWSMAKTKALGIS